MFGSEIEVGGGLLDPPSPKWLRPCAAFVVLYLVTGPAVLFAKVYNLRYHVDFIVKSYSWAMTVKLKYMDTADAVVRRCSAKICS